MIAWTRIEDNWPAFSTVWEAKVSDQLFFTIRWNVLEKQHNGQPTYWLFCNDERTVFSGTVAQLKLKVDEIANIRRTPRVKIKKLTPSSVAKGSLRRPNSP